MKIGICGHFGGGEVFLDGQTVKTKIVYEALCSLHSSENIKTVDTYKIKKRLIPVLFGTFRLFSGSDVCIMLPAHNGLKVFSRLFAFLKKLYKKKTYYVVIGGWLPEFIKDKPKIRASLETFDGILVETDTMRAALNELGYDNVAVLPNFKKLNLIEQAEIAFEHEIPYRLCTFSRVMKEKGIEDAINAVRMINEKIGKTVFTLDIYGQIDSGYAEEFERARENFPEYISYRGLVPFDRSSEVLREYCCLLFPTYYSGEGFAGTLIDAFASALPVIASDWKYNPEIVDDEVGVIFRAGDVQDLCRVLEDVYNGKYDLSAMRTSCLARARHYSFERAVEILGDNIKI